MSFEFYFFAFLAAWLGAALGAAYGLYGHMEAVRNKKALRRLFLLIPIVVLGKSMFDSYQRNNSLGDIFNSHLDGFASLVVGITSFALTSVIASRFRKEPS